MKKQPMRILEGSAKPHEPFWAVRDAAESESGEAEIDFYGYISEYSWFEDDITPALFKKDLAKIGQGGPVTVRIHSGGGDVFAASAIRAMLMDYPGKVTTRIDGLCASAATYIATAGDRVLMQDSGYFMIHDPWLFAVGGEEDLKAAIKFLKAVKLGIIEAYQSKTDLSKDELSRMMTAETWMTAQEAREKGFVDEVVTTPGRASMKNMAILNSLRSYDHVPADLLAGLSAENSSESTEDSGAEDGDAEDRSEIVEDNSVTSEDGSGISEDGSGISEDGSDTAEDSDAEDRDAEDGNTDDESAANKGGDPTLSDRLNHEAQRLRDYLEIFGPRPERK